MRHADPTRYAAAIGGTSGFAEWVIDADFLASRTPRATDATLEKGFWSIYDSVTLVGLGGARIGLRLRTRSRRSSAPRLWLQFAGIASDGRSPPI
jgi:hypothetical protein